MKSPAKAEFGWESKWAKSVIIKYAKSVAWIPLTCLFIMTGRRVRRGNYWKEGGGHGQASKYKQ